jgi:hypothetical protein
MAKTSFRRWILGLPLRFKEVASPATPPAGFVEVYAKADGFLYSKDDAGVETQVGNVWPKLAPNGSVGAPSYSFTNATGAGMYVAIGAFDSLRLATRGGDRVLIGDDGTNGWADIHGKGNGGVALYSGGALKFDVNNSRARVYNPLHLTEVATPGTPPSGEYSTYAKTGDSLLYGKNDAGLESRLSNFVVCTSATRPASPVDGMEIYETDTFKTLYYSAAKTGWFPPWNTAWGNLARVTLTGSTAAVGVTTTFTDMNLTNVPVRADRDYRIHIDTSVVISGAGPQWTLDMLVASAVAGRHDVFYAAQPWGERCHNGVLYQPAATGNVTIGVQAAELAGTATFQLAAAVGLPRQHWIEDIGPRT